MDKSLFRKPHARSQDGSETETTTSRTVYSNKTDHEHDVRNTRRCKSRQRKNYAQKTPHRIFSKEERLPPPITNYAVISRDSDFYKQLVNSQTEHYNSGKEKHSLDVMPFVITPIQNISDKQQKDDIEFLPRADSGKHSPASSMQQSPGNQKSSQLENRAMFPLPEFQSQTLPKTPMPGQPPELPNPIRDSQPSNSNTPPNSTSVTDKGKVAHFATKVKQKHRRNDPNKSLRKLERKGYKD